MLNYMVLDRILVGSCVLGFVVLDRILEKIRHQDCRVLQGTDPLLSKER